MSPENIDDKGQGLAYPDSVVAYFKGMMGQPEGGFPENLQKMVLKEEPFIQCRPGELLEPQNFEADAAYLKEEYGIEPTMRHLISYALYPKVFEDYLKFYNEYGDLSHMGSDIFFHGLYEGETCEVEVENHILQIKLLEVGKLDDDLNRTIVFEVNGNRREIKVHDKAGELKQGARSRVQMADAKNPMEIGSSIPGTVTKILVNEGDEVKENQEILIIEAMKMETVITAAVDGVVEAIHINEEQQVESGQLLMVIGE